MKLLFIGGTGLVSSACSELAVKKGHELTILNRALSSKYPLPVGAQLLKADVYADESRLNIFLSDRHFDAVVDFLAFTESDVERDLRLFRGRTGQFVFISSASVYQKPPLNYLITEKTPLENPFWQYARDKIACEKLLMRAFHEKRFPVTIIRPSLTYGPSQIPVLGASWQHPWTIIDRMNKGRKIIVPGDGSSLWVLTWNADFAEGLMGLLGCKDALGEAFHITSDEVLTWNRIITEIYRAIDIEPNMVHIPTDCIVAYNPAKLGTLLGDKANSVVFDNSKIKRMVPEFVCKVGWAEGVRRTLTWFEEDETQRTIDHEMNTIWDKIIAGYEKAFP